MQIRFRHWSTDGVPAHKASHGARDYVFLDADEGICDVRDRAGIEFLLARPANYEIAKLQFDAAGWQVQPDEAVALVDDPVTGEEEEAVEPEPIVRKRGRPRKVRR